VTFTLLRFSLLFFVHLISFSSDESFLWWSFSHVESHWFISWGCFFFNHPLQEEHLHVILTEASTVILVFSWNVGYGTSFEDGIREHCLLSTWIITIFCWVVESTRFIFIIHLRARSKSVKAKYVKTKKTYQDLPSKQVPSAHTVVRISNSYFMALFLW
jgi:hypothetical protein